MISAKTAKTLEMGSINEVRTLLYESAGEPGQGHWELLLAALEAMFDRGEICGRRDLEAELRARPLASPDQAETA